MSEQRPTVSDDPTLERRAQAALDRQVERLDGETRSRLTEARYRAVDAAAGTRHTRWLRWQLAGAAAAVAGVALTTWLMQVPPDALPGAEIMTDLELIELDADLELVEEAEFYQWLADAPLAADDA